MCFVFAGGEVHPLAGCLPAALVCIFRLSGRHWSLRWSFGVGIPGLVVGVLPGLFGRAVSLTVGVRTAIGWRVLSIGASALFGSVSRFRADRPRGVLLHLLSMYRVPAKNLTSSFLRCWQIQPDGTHLFALCCTGTLFSLPSSPRIPKSR